MRKSLPPPPLTIPCRVDWSLAGRRGGGGGGGAKGQQQINQTKHKQHSLVLLRSTYNPTTGL